MHGLGSTRPLSVTDVSIDYRGVSVVSGFSLSVERGEAVALVGPSGSGKSSILASILGLLVPAAGTVVVGGRAMSGQRERERSRLRREMIGVAHQDAALLPELTVAENVALVELLEGVPRDSAISRAEASLRDVGLPGFGGRRIDEISGGEAQRVAIARALVRVSVTLVVADEPTASLDARNAVMIGELLVERVKSRNIGAVVATHDERIATLCDRVVDLSSIGRVE